MKTGDEPELKRLHRVLLPWGQIKLLRNLKQGLKRTLRHQEKRETEAGPMDGAVVGGHWQG